MKIYPICLLVLLVGHLYGVDDLPQKDLKKLVEYKNICEETRKKCGGRVIDIKPEDLALVLKVRSLIEKNKNLDPAFELRALKNPTMSPEAIKKLDMNRSGEKIFGFADILAMLVAEDWDPKLVFAIAKNNFKKRIYY